MQAVTASGSEDLLIALQTPSPRGHGGIPALVWGRPGEGKSTFVEALGGPDFPVVTLIASIHDPTDFSGLPVHADGRLHFAPPEWTEVFDRAKAGILFLDELTTAPPAVQASLLRVVLERKVGFHTLPDEVRVVAAANPPDMVTGGWELSLPLLNRFVHIQWTLSGSKYTDALDRGFALPELPSIDVQEHGEAVDYWRMMVRAFLRRDVGLVHTEPAEGEYSFASPRTWDYAIHLMATCDLLSKAPKPGRRGKPVFLRLLKGAVGSGPASTFVNFLKNMRLPDPDRVLDGKASVKVDELQDDELHVLFSSLASCLLRRGKSPGKRRVDDALVFFSLVEQVTEEGRVDTVFAPVRQVAQGQILPRAVQAARQQGCLAEFRELLSRVFDGTPLADYVNVLGDSP